MATVFMKWDSVKGAATGEGGGENEGGYKDWIDITSISFGIERNIKSGFGQTANREAAHPVVNAISLSKPACIASPSLFLTSVCGHQGKGEAVPKVIIHLCFPSDDGKLSPYARIHLDHVMIAKYKVSGEADGAPKEEFELRFSNISYQFRAVDDLNKDVNKTSGFKYNLMNNKKMAGCPDMSPLT
jgi:type VI secretion system secreted protein Hcp